MKVNIISRIWHFFFECPSNRISEDEFGGYLIPEIWKIERKRLLKIEVKRLNLMGFSKEAKRLEKRLKKEERL